MNETNYRDSVQGGDVRMPRRDFLVTLIRGLVAGSLLAVIGTLVAKHGRETCAANGICRDCSALAQCGLPQALSVKVVQSHGK